MAREILADIEPSEATKAHDIKTLQKLDRMLEEIYNGGAVTIVRVALNSSGQATLTGYPSVTYTASLTAVTVEASSVIAGNLVLQLDSTDLIVLSSSGALDEGVLVDCVLFKR